MMALGLSLSWEVKIGNPRPSDSAWFAGSWADNGQEGAANSPTKFDFATRFVCMFALPSVRYPLPYWPVRLQGFSWGLSSKGKVVDAKEVGL